jgi:predicted choloylglycine hydrolase
MLNRFRHIATFRKPEMRMRKNMNKLFPDEKKHLIATRTKKACINHQHKLACADYGLQKNNEDISNTASPLQSTNQYSIHPSKSGHVAGGKVAMR